jgi:hypothetical protein
VLFVHFEQTSLNLQGVSRLVRLELPEIDVVADKVAGAPSASLSAKNGVTTA